MNKCEAIVLCVTDDYKYLMLFTTFLVLINRLTAFKHVKKITVNIFKLDGMLESKSKEQTFSFWRFYAVVAKQMRVGKANGGGVGLQTLLWLQSL